MSQIAAVRAMFEAAAEERERATREERNRVLEILHQVTFTGEVPQEYSDGWEAALSAAIKRIDQP